MTYFDNASNPVLKSQRMSDKNCKRFTWRQTKLFVISTSEPKLYLQKNVYNCNFGKINH
jgi:hypothetical protein